MIYIFQPSGAPPVIDTLSYNDPTGPFYGNILFYVLYSPIAVSVDSFFFIGSTLLSYLNMLQLEKYRGGNSKFWFKFYVHRYIRQTGVYATCIGLTASLLKFLATGPSSFIVTNQVNYCKEGWWRSLLYISNFDKMPEVCFTHAWYKPLVGWVISRLAMLAATITPMVVA